MTHKYGSKFGALSMGMFYAGRPDLYQDVTNLEELLKVEGVEEIKDLTIGQFGEECEDCTMVEITNMNGIQVRLASCKFRGEFDLWIVSKDGMSMRA